MTVTVTDIISLPVMRNAVLVAGQKGLGSSVRWVHISELLDIARLLKGGELLLTTGMGLSVPPEQQKKYIYELAGRGVAAVAISLSAFGREVPEAMIAAADEVDLPLIAITRECPFVQLTEDVHTLIVNRHYAEFRQAEEVARELNRAALQKQDVTEILRILYQTLQNPVACVSYDDAWRTQTADRPGQAGEPDSEEADEGRLRACYPTGEWGSALIAELVRRDQPGGWVDDDELEPGASPMDPAAPSSSPVRIGRRLVDVWLQPIVVSGQRWGFLAVVQASRHLSEVERLVVDRAAVTLAYEILRRRSLREQRRGTLSRLADMILCGQIADVSLVYQRARSLGHNLEDRWFAAGVVKGSPGTTQAEVEQRTAGTCAQLGLGHVYTWKTGTMHLVLYGTSESGLRTHLGSLVRALEAGQRVQAGIGRIKYGLDGLDKSRKQAEFTLALRRGNSASGSGAFFDSTGVYRLFVSALEPGELHRFVQEELGALLHLEELDRDALLETLEVMLDTNLAMASASRLLGLSRQTLYQRRERLEELLRCTLDDAQKRLSLSLALSARRYESITPAHTAKQR